MAPTVASAGLWSTVKAFKDFCSTFFCVSESSCGGEEEKAKEEEKEKEEVGRGEGGKENIAKAEEEEVSDRERRKESTAKAGDRVTPLPNISKKTAKRILELLSDESVSGDAAPALLRKGRLQGAEFWT